MDTFLVLISNWLGPVSSEVKIKPIGNTKSIWTFVKKLSVLELILVILKNWGSVRCQIELCQNPGTWFVDSLCRTSLDKMVHIYYWLAERLPGIKCYDKNIKYITFFCITIPLQNYFIYHTNKYVFRKGLTCIQVIGQFHL